MVIPLIFGKMAKDILSGDFSSQVEALPALGVGFVTAFFTGLLACVWMLKLVKQSGLTYFSYYCFIVGFLSIVISLFLVSTEEGLCIDCEYCLLGVNPCAKVYASSYIGMNKPIYLEIYMNRSVLMLGALLVGCASADRVQKLEEKT